MKHPASEHHHRRRRGSDGNAEIFAEAVTDRADHQLHRTVRQQVDGDHDRGGAHARMQICGNLRQKRISNPHDGLGGDKSSGEAGGSSVRA